MADFEKIFAEDVTITLRKEEALVLFETLVDRVPAELNSESHASIPLTDEAERLALSRLVARFESSLVELFMKDYSAIVEEAKRRLLTNPNA